MSQCDMTASFAVRICDGGYVRPIDIQGGDRKQLRVYPGIVSGCADSDDIQSIIIIVQAIDDRDLPSI